MPAVEPQTTNFKPKYNAADDQYEWIFSSLGGFLSLWVLIWGGETVACELLISNHQRNHTEVGDPISHCKAEEYQSPRDGSRLFFFFLPSQLAYS